MAEKQATQPHSPRLGSSFVANPSRGQALEVQRERPWVNDGYELIPLGEVPSGKLT
jgi:hypothetical protein